MSFSRRPVLSALALSVSLFISASSSALAQSDAETALNDARQALQDQQFERARDLAHTASQTDANNPDVFLLLGKAHFQLGELDDALSAWRTLLRLAPNHEYGRRMVAVLEGRNTDVDVRIRLAQLMFNDGLTETAQKELSALRLHSVLSPDQRIQVLTLLADLAVFRGNGEESLALIREIVSRDAALAESPGLRLRTAQAQLVIGGEHTGRGLAELQRLAAESGDTAEGKTAALDLLLHRLSHGENVVADVTTWIGNHGELPVARRARLAVRVAVNEFLQASAKQPPPEEDDAELNDHDKAAIAAAAHALRTFVDVPDQLAVAQLLTDHLEKRYVSAQAWSAARNGIALIEAIEISQPVKRLLSQSRRKVDEAEAAHELAVITKQVHAATAAPEQLKQWITDHPDHPQNQTAVRALITAWLNATRRMAVPDQDTELHATDKAAIELAAELAPQLSKDADREALLKTLSDHFQKHYFDRGAHAAAIEGMQGVIRIKKGVGRLALLMSLREMQTKAAIAEIAAAVANGTIPGSAAPMPDSLKAAAATTAQISAEYPAGMSWKAHAELGRQVLDATASVPWPSTVAGPRAGQQWAIDLALRVLEATDDRESVAHARLVIDRVVGEMATVAQPNAVSMAVNIHEKLLTAVPEDHALRSDIVLRHVDLLTAEAARVFDANLRSGEGNRNAEQTDVQKSIMTLLSEVVSREPAKASVVTQKLNAPLQKWLEAGHDAIVETSYQALAADLPAASRRQIELSLASLWFNQVLREHSRIMANGFKVPRALDLNSEKALKTCYRLAASVGARDTIRAQVGALRKRIIDHYLALKYEDVAEAAIKVNAAPPNADMEERTELELAALQRRIAEQQLAQQLRTHNGRRKIELSPAFQATIASLKTFINAHPTSDHVPAAAHEIFSLAKSFEKLKAWSVAAGIYEEFEQFAQQKDTLKQSLPADSTWPERAAVARAEALHTGAAEALKEWNRTRKGDSPVPEQLSNEFQAAQAVWHEIITNYQQRPVAQTAIVRSMAIAQEYAALNAWDVSAAVYDSLLKLELPLRSPERLEFAQAICLLGKVLPDHARAVLAALDVTSTGRGDDDQDPSESLIAMGDFGLLKYREESVASRGPASRRPAPDMPATNAPVAEEPGSAEGQSGGDPTPSATTQPAGPTEVLEADLDEIADVAKSEAAAGRSIGGFGGGMNLDYERRFRQKQDAQLIAAVRTQLDRQASQIAMLRDQAIQHRGSRVPAGKKKNNDGKIVEAAATVLSDAELQRQQTVLDAVYAALQDIRNRFEHSSSATQARDEIFVIVNHWREISQWDRAARLADRFLTDNPTDIRLPQIRQEIARDWLAWASQGVRDSELDREELLSEITDRFTAAREELQKIIVEFPDETTVRQQAQWDIANSFLTQARVVADSSPTLARGQFVRAANELLRVAELFHDHPKIGTIPDMLWGISLELLGRSYHDEAISVWNELQIHYPTHALADQSALKTAQTWQQIGQPLRAAEAYLELNFARGGSDAALQETIYQIAVQLKNEKRWIESLHVLQTFVDSFPSHGNAGQTLTMIGQIHQANEVWEDAITAYRRVIDEFPTGAWTTEARWSIAECTINLSLWQEAAGAYADFQQSYPKDSRVAEAARRIEVLKTLDRYQDVVDEEGQRKAFDAQYQVATIVRQQLTNPVKAVIEYRKVEQNWPNSHLADDALFEIGRIYLERGETELARTALLQAAKRYPQSPLADDALLLVGNSFVSEADQLAAVDRGKSQEIAKDIAQRAAYQAAQDNRRRQTARNLDQIAILKSQGKRGEAANKEAYFAGQALQFDAANTANLSAWAAQQEEVLSAAQLADRQDKINAALRQAVSSFRQAAGVNAADKADDALLRMAQIYDERLKDSAAAMSTWQEIVKQYSGTAVAEDASWKMARFYENEREHQKAIDAYQAFFRNYRRSARAGEAQAAIAENHEKLGEWVQAMDAYTNYVNNFPKGPLLKKAQDQINWIKTYRL